MCDTSCTCQARDFVTFSGQFHFRTGVPNSATFWQIRESGRAHKSSCLQCLIATVVATRLFDTYKVYNTVRYERQKQRILDKTITSDGITEIDYMTHTGTA